MGAKLAIGLVLALLVALLGALRWEADQSSKEDVNITNSRTLHESPPSDQEVSRSTGVGVGPREYVPPSAEEVTGQPSLLERLRAIPVPMDQFSLGAWRDSVRAFLDGEGSGAALLATLEFLDELSTEDELERTQLDGARATIAMFLGAHPELLGLAMDEFRAGSSNTALCLAMGLKLAVADNQLDSIALEWERRYSAEESPYVQDFLAVNSSRIGDEGISESIIRAELERRDAEDVGLSRAVRAIRNTLEGEQRLREYWLKGAPSVLGAYPEFNSIPDSTGRLFQLLVERASRNATDAEVGAIRRFLSRFPEGADALSTLEARIGSGN